MSPRSEEFLEQARQRLADAKAIRETAHPALVLSAAYYAMLYAARAALSERGEYAKTHSGTWTLFSRTFVVPGDFDQGLSAMARRAKEAREQGDYEAVSPTQEEADEFVRGAADFIAKIERMLDSPAH